VVEVLRIGVEEDRDHGATILENSNWQILASQTSDAQPHGDTRKVRRVQEDLLRTQVEDHSHDEAEVGLRVVQEDSTGRIQEAEEDRSRDEEAEDHAHRTQPCNVVAWE